MPLIFWSVDTRLQLTMSIGGGLGKLNLEPNQVVGTTLFQFFRTDDRNYPPIAAHQQALRGISSQFELALLGRLYQVHLEPLFEEDGTISGCFGFGMDITDRKRTELEREVIFEIAAGITTSANLDELLKLIHRSLKRVVYAENCFIALHNKSTELFESAFFVDEVDTPFPPHRLGKSCSAYVYRTGKPLLLTQNHFEELVRDREVELVGTNSPSWVGIPLKTPKESIGVLVLQHYRDANAYSQRDLEFLTSVGNQIALAIERKRTQEALEESGRRFRSLVQNSSDIITIIGRDGIVLYQSPSVSEALGYEAEDLVGRVGFDFVHPDDRPGAMKTFEELATRPDSTRRTEYRISHKNGTWRVFESTGTNLLEEPAIGGVVINSRDITERKRSEQLQSAIYRIAQAADVSPTLDDLFRAVHLIISEVMPAGNFYISLYDDKEKTLTFPYFVDEVDITPPKGPVGKGLTAYVLRTGKSLLCDEPLFQELARRGEAQLVGAPSAIWLGVPLVVENKSIGVMVVQHYTDSTAYTERERQMLEFVSSEVARSISQKSAQEQIQLFAHAFQSTSELISITDLEDQFIFVNKSFLDAYGYAMSDVIGRRPDILGSQKNPPGVQAEILKKTRSGGWSGELFNRKKDGSDFQISLNTSIIRDSGGNAIGYIGVAQDITERKRTELIQSALYRIADRARSAGTLDELFISIHGILGELMYARNCYVALRDPLNGNVSFPYWINERDDPPASRKNGRALTEFVLRTGKPLLATPRELEMLVKRGEVIRHGSPSLDWMGVPLRSGDETFGVLALQTYEQNIRYGDADQEILTFVSQQIASAIEAKQSQVAIRESEEKFRKLAETATAAIFIYQENSFRYVNPAMETITGYSKNELLNMNFWDVVHPDFRDLVKQRGLERQSGKPVEPRYEFMLERKDHQSRWVDFSSILIEYEGKSAGLGTAYDITAHMDAADALRKSEEKYRTLFEESKDVIFITDPSGKFIDINPAGVELLGYGSQKEILAASATLEQFVSLEDQREVLRSLQKQGFIKDYELILKRKDGLSRIVLETTYVVRGDSGTVVAHRGIMKDISEYKKLEEQLRQKQKLESIGTLAGGIAHDFNNILNIILGYASFLEEGDADRQRMTESIDVIRKAVRRGADLVQQILTFARKGDVTLESVSLNEVVKDLAKMLTETFPRTVIFSLKFKEGLPTIIGDRTQLQQTLLNLCVNARDAMSTGGLLTIRTEVVHGRDLLQKFSEAVEDDYVHLTVEDTGVGMDEMTRSRIFEPFFTTKERGRGTGLGLAVAYGVVRSHRGFIEVESTPGKGTKCHLYFPIPTQDLKSLERKTKEFESIRGGSETILIVEDEEMLLNLVKRILETKGYTILTAKDGVEALEQYRTNKDKISLVLTDLGLPKLGGFEAFLEMKKINPGLKTILASGYLDPDLKADILKAGARDFIQKPYDPNEILRKIRNVIEAD